jgi:hypothetical protein
MFLLYSFIIYINYYKFQFESWEMLMEDSKTLLKQLI